MQMQTVPFVGGCGQLKANLSCEGTDFKGIEMLDEERGVNVSYKGQEFLVPWGNIVCVTYADKRPTNFVGGANFSTSSVSSTTTTYKAK